MRRLVITTLGGSLVLLIVGMAATADAPRAYGQNGHWSKWLGPLFHRSRNASPTTPEHASSQSSSQRSPSPEALASNANTPPTPDAVLSDLTESNQLPQRAELPLDKRIRDKKAERSSNSSFSRSPVDSNDQQSSPATSATNRTIHPETPLSASNTETTDRPVAPPKSQTSSAVPSVSQAVPQQASRPKSSRRRARSGMSHKEPKHKPSQQTVRLASNRTLGNQETTAVVNAEAYDLDRRFEQLKHQLPDEPLEETDEDRVSSNASDRLTPRSASTLSHEAVATDRGTNRGSAPNLFDSSPKALRTGATLADPVVTHHAAPPSVFALPPSPQRKQIVEPTADRPFVSRSHHRDATSNRSISVFDPPPKTLTSQVSETATPSISNNRAAGTVSETLSAESSLASPVSDARPAATHQAFEAGGFVRSNTAHKTHTIHRAELSPAVSAAFANHLPTPANPDASAHRNTGLTASTAGLPPTAATHDALSIHWEAPQELNRGEKARFQLFIRNRSRQPALGVTVHVRLPETAQLVDSLPPANLTGDVLQWEIGRIEAEQQVQIELQLLATTAGEMMPAAAVTTTRLSAARVAVLDPQLTIVVESPEQIALGQTAFCTVRVSNSGSGPARQVTLTTWVDEPLAALMPSQREYAVGTLLPGHWRDIRVTLSGKTAGTAAIRALACGASGIEAEASRQIRVVEPRLSVAIDGPKLRFVDRPARYTVSVYNPGPTAAENVQVFDLVPEGFRFVEASPGGSFNSQTREVAWFVGRLEPGHTAEVDVQLIPVAPGEHQVVAAAVAEATSLARTSLLTRVEGSVNLVMEVVDADDPIEAGGETTYEIRLTNRGSVAASDVQIAALLSNGLNASEANGPVDARVQSERVVFDPLPSLESGQTVVYHIRARCLEEGQGRLRAFVRSRELSEPMVEEESTRIYAD